MPRSGSLHVGSNCNPDHLIKRVRNRKKILEFQGNNMQ